MQNFIKIGSAVWAVELTQTDKHTHVRMQSHTHTLGSIATYSVEMTKYKKVKQLLLRFSNQPLTTYGRFHAI